MNPFFFQMANIREHCSWVIDDRQQATLKAGGWSRLLFSVCITQLRLTCARCR